MNRKHFLITLIITIILVTAVFILKKREQKLTTETENSIGREIFPVLPLNHIKELQILKDDSPAISIIKEEDGWKVTNRYNYPANFSRISSFLMTIVELKNKQNLLVSPAAAGGNAEKSQLARLGLMPPENKTGAGVLVKIFGEKQKVLTSFILGEKHVRKAVSREAGIMEWPDGRYLLIQGKEQAVLIDKTLNEADSSLAEWLDKTFISAGKLRAASLSINGSPRRIEWKISRKAPEENMSFESMPKDKELDETKINSISDCLTNFSFSDIANPSAVPAETGLDSPSIFMAETFDGIKYELMIGREKDSMRFVKISVSQIDIPMPEAPKDEKKEDKEKREKEYSQKIEAAAKKVKDEQEKFGKWIYLINNYSLKTILSEKKDLFKEKKEELKKVEG